MTDFTDKEFKRVDVDMDGNTFTGCHFVQCDLVFRGKAFFSMIQCTLSGSNFRFDEAAGLTLAQLTHMYQGGFAPIVDGLIDQIRTARPAQHE